jgi:hypothetical protein
LIVALKDFDAPQARNVLPRTQAAPAPELWRASSVSTVVSTVPGKKKAAPAEAPHGSSPLACYFSLIIGPASVMLPFTSSVSIFSF